MTTTTYLKGSPTLAFSKEFAKNFPEITPLKIISAIIKLVVKNI